MIEALGDSPLVLSDRRKHAAYCDTLLQDLRAMKVEFVEPVTETDDPNDPAFAVLAHCSSGPNFGPDPAGSEKSFSALDDIGDSGYRLYFLDRGSAHNPGYVVVYASVAKGKEISAPPLRMTGYNLIDARRCIREFGAQVRRDNIDEDLTAAVVRWRKRWFLLSLSRFGSKPPYSFQLWADTAVGRELETRSVSRIESCYWY
jgi:hypothetical protein